MLSVHNPGYQGHFPPETMPDVGLPWEIYNWHQLEWYGKMNFLKGGLVFTDFVTTVSPTQAARAPHARAAASACTTCFSELGDRLVGVLNGIDQREWDPATDTQITATVLGRAPRGQAALQGRAAALVRAAAAAEDARSSG